MDRIAKEKTRLIKEGVIKGKKPLPKVRDKEKPFEISSGWAWARWDDFTEWMTDGFTRPMPHVETGPLILTAKNVQYGYIEIADADCTTEEAFH